MRVLGRPVAVLVDRRALSVTVWLSSTGGRGPDLIVRTRTPLAQLLPVFAAALVSRLSTMIITFTCDMYSGIRAARRELFAFAVWMR